MDAVRIAAAEAAMSAVIIEGAHVVTVDRASIADGHVVIEGNEITAVGAGPAPSEATTTIVDGRGCLLTPGFVNSHHHLYQWVTRGLARGRRPCSSGSTALYPVWARIDDEHAVHTARPALWRSWR